MLTHRVERNGQLQIDRNRTIRPAQDLANQFPELAIGADQCRARYASSAHDIRASLT
jgi:hypothetical protein